MELEPQQKAVLEGVMNKVAQLKSVGAKPTLIMGDFGKGNPPFSVVSVYENIVGPRM